MVMNFSSFIIWIWSWVEKKPKNSNFAFSCKFCPSGIQAEDFRWNKKYRGMNICSSYENAWEEEMIVCFFFYVISDVIQLYCWHIFCQTFKVVEIYIHKTLNSKGFWYISIYISCDSLFLWSSKSPVSRYPVLII